MKTRDMKKILSHYGYTRLKKTTTGSHQNYIRRNVYDHLRAYLKKGLITQGKFEQEVRKECISVFLQHGDKQYLKTSAYRTMGVLVKDVKKRLGCEWLTAKKVSIYFGIKL